MSENLFAIPGSAPLRSLPAGYPAPSQEIEFTLTLRRKSAPPQATAPPDALLSQLPHQRHYLTHAELAEATGADAADVATLEAYFQPFGIHLKSTSLLLRRVTLAGSVQAFEQAFATEIAAFQAASPTQFLATTAPLRVPAPLHELIFAVQPLQPPVRKEWRPTPKPTPLSPYLLKGFEADAPGPPTSYSVPELAQAYRFPTGATGAGQVVGIVELGGQFSAADLAQYFTSLGRPQPEIIEVGTSPNPTTAQLEVTMDVEIVGALLPQAKVVVYYAVTLAEALQAIVADEDNKPSVVSISWAGSEHNYTAQEVQTLNDLCYQAALLGITLVAASADLGAFNGLSFPNVSLPSSNPLVLGCGGTTATIAAGALTQEVVWNEIFNNNPADRMSSGGGFSHLYPLPGYQGRAVASYPYPLLQSGARGVPDLAAHASGQPGYQLIFNGQPTLSGGTSAATPLVAALLALLNEQLGYRLGFVNAVLYALAGSPAFNPITQGNNSFYAAAPYWNPCTGLGSPVGEQLLALLQQAEHVGSSATPALSPDDQASA